MQKENQFKIWMQQIRGPFLILPIVLVLIGVSSAFAHGFVNWVYSIFLLIGVIFAHISVNLFNELSDHRTKIDEHTVRTPFSGGSGMLQSGKTSLHAVRSIAYSMLILSAVIGFYFFYHSGWLILVLMFIGAVAVRFYTSHLAKWLIGEFISGLTLGTFVVWGVYYSLTGMLSNDIIYISIPPGILTSLLLFLNEFPDAEADKLGGRRHLIIQFGKKTSAHIYLISLVLVYGMIIAGPLLLGIPKNIYIALITLPLAIMSIRILYKNLNDNLKLIPAQGMNVGIVILTDLLLGIAYFL